MPSKDLSILAAVGALFVAAPAAHANVQPATHAVPAIADAASVNRVWKFGVEIEDVASPGKLRVTVRNVRNVPKRMRAKADALVGEEAIVVLSGTIRIYRNGKPAPGGLSDLIGKAVIRGELLAASESERNRDGDRVPTIRAYKIDI